MGTKSTCSILVVDDHPDSRELLREWLSGHGYPVLEAGDGKQALDMLLSNAHDEPVIIVLDLDMPVMSGWEFLSITATHRRLARIPVVLTSGSANAPEARRHRAVVGHIPKPVDLTKLLATVKQHTGKDVVDEEA
jgi:two-component system, response regulator, stage 0 sporulation protein F